MQDEREYNPWYGIGDAPPTRAEVLPPEVASDLTLVLFWCEHYGGQAEQDATERLVDYFAQPAE